MKVLVACEFSGMHLLEKNMMQEAAIYYQVTNQVYIIKAM
jgi:hypothetical protein